MSKRIHNLTLTLLAAGTLALAPSGATASADTIYVCWDGSGDYVTIQEGIDAASDGDEVVVCDGTYTGPGNRHLDFHGKAITVRSASGDPVLCIIDCEEFGHRGLQLRRRRPLLGPQQPDAHQLHDQREFGQAGWRRLLRR